MANGAVITNGGLNVFLDRMYASTYTVASRIRVGTGTTTPTTADTALGTDLPGPGYISFSSYYTDTGNNRTVATATLSASQGNGSTISEIGEFNTDGTPVMMSHDVFTGIAKTSSKTITFTITHQGSQG